MDGGCARFSRKAVTRRLTAALLPSACLLAFFGFVGILYFLPACLIIITHTHKHTHTAQKKKAGAQPQNLPKSQMKRKLNASQLAAAAVYAALPLGSASAATTYHVLSQSSAALLCFLLLGGVYFQTDVFLALFSAHGHTHRKLKVTGLNYCIKKIYTSFE